MAINHTDGRYTLFLWLSETGEGEPDAMEFSDSKEELRTRAETIIAANRYKYIWFGEWNADHGDWDEIDEFFVSEAAN